jgi:hypothetical protein
MGQPTRQGKKGSRKIGRNKAKCAKYFATGRLVKNKARKTAKRARRLERRKLVKELRSK